MKPIKLVEKNKNILVDEINAVKGKNQANCLTFIKLLEIAQHAENRMTQLNIPVCKRAGAKFYYRPDGPWAKFYKFPQGATDARIIRKSAGWYLEKTNRVHVFPLQRALMDLTITEEQRDIALEKFCRSFIIKRKPAQVTTISGGDNNECK